MPATRRIAMPLGLALLLVAWSLEPAQSQSLNQTQWYESLALNGDEQTAQGLGADDSSPEPQSNAISGSTWSLDGDITFGPPGPPHVTTQVNGSHTSGAAFFLGATAYVMISFEFQLTQIASAPVTITSVPLTVHSQGSATTTGDEEFFAIAFAFLDLGWEGGPLVSMEARATNTPTDEWPDSDSFNESQRFTVPPTAEVFGSMASNANIAAEVPQSGIAASAEAFIDPIIEVADETIPGTSMSYRDVFEVEMSDGFFALGDPTSVRRAGWGTVKSLYRTRPDSR
jgi:hypothetical protein